MISNLVLARKPRNIEVSLLTHGISPKNSHAQECIWKGQVYVLLQYFGALRRDCREIGEIERNASMKAYLPLYKPNNKKNAKRRFISLVIRKRRAVVALNSSELMKVVMHRQTMVVFSQFLWQCETYKTVVHKVTPMFCLWHNLLISEPK